MYLKVGHLRQLVSSALKFSFELVAQGTPIAGAELEMKEVPATGSCRGCGAESRLEDFPLQCGVCGGYDLEIVEGEEKPLKYPLMFRLADLVLVSKLDLLEHLDFDLEQFLGNLDAVNPGVERILTSARTGQGVDEWCS